MRGSLLDDQGGSGHGGLKWSRCVQNMLGPLGIYGGGYVSQLRVDLGPALVPERHIRAYTLQLLEGDVGHAECRCKGRHIAA